MGLSALGVTHSVTRNPCVTPKDTSKLIGMIEMKSAENPGAFPLGRRTRLHKLHHQINLLLNHLQATLPWAKHFISLGLNSHLQMRTADQMIS